MISPPPPAELASLASVVGAAGTLALIEAHGGTRLKVTVRRPSAHLIRLVGYDAAATLVRQIGGNQIKVPLAKRWRCLVYRNQGASYSQIARRLGVTEDIVHRWLQGAAMTHTQYQLAL